MKIVIDTAARTLVEIRDGVESTHPLFSKEAFEAVSLEWVKIGWSLRYYHNFSWFGFPILQLPEDLLRLQEVIYRVRPKVILETGVFRGGSLMFHATLLEAIGGGRVIGIDREIPLGLRESIASHKLGSRISLIEGNSTQDSVVAEVAQLIGSDNPVLVILDSGHSKDHVAAELAAYSRFVTLGSYIVATDGVMRDLTDVPGGDRSWKSDNPSQAASEFAAHHPEFRQGQPPWLFHAGPITDNVTYWPDAWLEKISE